MGSNFHIKTVRKKWPGEGDSNPRRCYPCRFSRPVPSTARPSPDFFKFKKEPVEATPGFEPGIRALQAPALATWLCRPRKVVPGAGLEPARPKRPRDFKSLVSTYSTTRASKTTIKWSGRRDSNPRPQPWQGCALPLSYSRNFLSCNFELVMRILSKTFLK